MLMIIARSLIEFLKSKDFNNLTIEELSDWASQNGCKLTLPDCVNVFEILSEGRERFIFGDAVNGIVEIGIMPISFWPLGDEITDKERSEFEEQYAAIKREIETILSDVGTENIDKAYYNFKNTKWNFRNGTVWLYQDARDPMFGSELSISFVKGSRHGPY